MKIQSDGYVPAAHRVVHPRTGAVVVEVLGEHDLATRDSIQDLFFKLVEHNDLLVVDVSEATFIDSSFLNALVKTHRHADQLGNRMRVQIGTAPIVHKVLEISDLTDYLDCVSDRDEALKP